MLSQEDKTELALTLHEIGVVKFGEFTFKSGIISPMYCDHRILVSYPKKLKYVAKQYTKLLEGLEYDRLAGIPYAAMPIAGAVSLLLEQPWIYPRKEAKDYGTKKVIEGEFKPGDKVVVLDDLITKGDSKIETLEPFLAADLKVADFVVLLDYEKGGREMLKRKGYNLHAAMSVKDLVEALHQQKAIDEEMYAKVAKFLSDN
ncbi:MAG: orotate phosphoribosyltransferase [bacterium]|nr:orotate phosphoribosyltransferase [bacterium]